MRDLLHQEKDYNVWRNDYLEDRNKNIINDYMTKAERA